MKFMGFVLSFLVAVCLSESKAAEKLILKSVPDIASQIKTDLKSSDEKKAVKILEFHDRPVSVQDLTALLNDFPNVNSLIFYGSNTVDLKNVPKNLLNRISNVAVFEGSFSKENLEAIATLPNLKQFNLRNKHGIRSEEELEVIKNNTTIETLYLDGAYTENVFPLLSTMTKLRAVSIESEKPINQHVAQYFVEEERKKRPSFIMKVHSEGKTYTFYK